MTQSVHLAEKPSEALLEGDRFILDTAGEVPCRNPSKIAQKKKGNPNEEPKQPMDAANKHCFLCQEENQREIQIVHLIAT